MACVQRERSPVHAAGKGGDLAVEKTMVCGVNASYKVSSWFTALVQADYVSIANYGNMKDVVRQNDIQIVVSARFSF